MKNLKFCTNFWKKYIQSLIQLTLKYFPCFEETEQCNQHNKLLSDAKDYREKREIEEKENKSHHWRKEVMIYMEYLV